jgi:hypothetical protein
MVRIVTADGLGCPPRYWEFERLLVVDRDRTLGNTRKLARKLGVKIGRNKRTELTARLSLRRRRRVP